MTSQSTSRVISARRKNNLRAALTLASLLALWTFHPRTADAEWLGDSRPLMGTEISVQLWHDEPAAGNKAVEAVFDEMERINQLMSTYIDDSQISLINREAADHAVAAGEELYDLIVRSLDISILTRGAFDITYDSVGQHYDFRQKQRPDSKTLEQELTHINYRLIETYPSTRSIHFLQQGVRINLGGIAKGYAVERGVGILRDLGIKHAIVTAGGDSRLLGDRRGQPWMVGVRDPRNEGKVAIRMPLENEAISTSGDYERYFEQDGKRYHHIIQPSTGEPANGIHSATIVGPDAVMTDALSTSVFVMGVDQGLRLISTLPDYEGIVIDAEGKLFYSDGLQPPDQNL
jgi:FAD:protein FMN transferase